MVNGNKYVKINTHTHTLYSLKYNHNKDVCLHLDNFQVLYSIINTLRQYNIPIMLLYVFKDSPDTSISLIIKLNYKDNMNEQASSPRQKL